MIAVDQTKFLYNGERGNCLAACLASIFETTIKNVPALETLPPGTWRESLHAWVNSQGYKITEVSADSFNDAHYIAVGVSKNGNKHATVGLGGKIVHDPDLERFGLVQVDYLFVFKKIPYRAPSKFKA